MAEYKIAEIDLIEAQSKRVKTIVTTHEYTKRGEWWIATLATVIAENYCCRCAVTRTSGAQKRTIMFIGLEGDVDICDKIFSYAIDTARTCGENYFRNKMGRYCRYTHAEKNKIKNSYAIGFAYGVQEAFNKQKQENEVGWGLVMVVPKEVDEVISGYSKDRYTSNHSVYNNVREKGYEEGCKFNPNGRVEGDYNSNTSRRIERR